MRNRYQPDRIKRRRAAITERMKRLDRLEQFIYQEKRKLSQELNELAAVEKVLARLAQSNDSDLLNNISELIEEPSAEEQQQSEFEAPDASIPRVGTTRPTGIQRPPKCLIPRLPRPSAPAKRAFVAAILSLESGSGGGPAQAGTRFCPQPFCSFRKAVLVVRTNCS